MSDLVLEIIRAIVVCVIFVYLWVVGGKEKIRQLDGWLYILAGFGLILFGMFIDITDNFPSLNHYIIIGDTKYQAFLEKVVGYLFGFILLTVGFWKWMPTIVMHRKAERELKKSYNEQELIFNERAEEALRESEKRYRLLAENATDVIWTMDMNMKFTYFSPSIERLRGYTAEETLSQTVEETLTPDSYNIAMKIFAEELEKHNKGERDPNRPTRLELELTHKNGPTIQTELETNFIYDLAGQPTGVIGIIRDISKRKQEEEEKEQLQIRLQQAQKMETIGTLAGGVAHDLNNILSGIVSYPELLLLDLPEDSPLRKPILTIQKSGEKAAVIVQDLLTLARRGVSIEKVVNLNNIISEQLKSPEFEKLKSFHSDVQVETNFERDLPKIKGSTTHLSKTIMNLISNAAEAMPDGGAISISTEYRYIDRPIRRYDHVEEGDYVTATVSDTGIGISSEDIERIFEPFYTKKVMGRSGTGLGMAVIWGTVKDHKGYIDVESTEGKGTTFTLYFPITMEIFAKEEARLSIEDYTGKGESILIVDDVEEQRELASKMLNKLCYSAYAVSSGEEAVEYMEKYKADLIMLDMIMDPGIDGLDTYTKILELYPEQKAIIASGFSETDRVKKAQSLGAGQYIKKPYTLDKIGLAVKEELER